MALKVFKTVNSKAIKDGDLFGYWDLAAGDTAAPVLVPRFSDKSIHIFGVWDGATIDLLGGNDPDLAQYDTVFDYEGTVITQIANGKPWVILPNLYALKPVISNGDASTAIRVAIIGRGGR